MACAIRGVSVLTAKPVHSGVPMWDRTNLRKSILLKKVKILEKKMKQNKKTQKMKATTTKNENKKVQNED